MQSRISHLLAMVKAVKMLVVAQTTTFFEVFGASDTVTFKAMLFTISTDFRKL